MAFFFYFEIDHRLKIKTIAQRTFFRAEIQIFSPIFSLPADRFSDDFSVFHPPHFFIHVVSPSPDFFPVFLSPSIFISWLLCRFFPSPMAAPFFLFSHDPPFYICSPNARFSFSPSFYPIAFSGTKKCAPKYAFLLSYYFLFLEGGLYVVIRPLLAHAHFSANRADDGADDAG